MLISEKAFTSDKDILSFRKDDIHLPSNRQKVCYCTRRGYHVKGKKELILMIILDAVWYMESDCNED